MDAGIAAIVSASISTAVGGTLGFLSSYLTTRQSQKNAASASLLPKRLSSAEYLGMLLFKAMAGEHIGDETWNKYISACYWLPEELRSTCLEVLGHKDDPAVIASAHKAIIDYCDNLMKGAN